MDRPGLVPSKEKMSDSHIYMIIEPVMTAFNTMSSERSTLRIKNLGESGSVTMTLK